MVKGKKVRCVKGHYRLEKNKIYTINAVFHANDEYYISVDEIDNGRNSFYAYRFEKIMPKMPKNIITL